MNFKLKTNTFYWIFFILFILCACFIMFYKLGMLNVMDWDEARHGINAYEMLKNRNYINSTFLYQTDYWNLKPPLSYWCIMLSYQLFGLNVFSMRIYSAICYIMTIAVAALWCKKSYNNRVSLLTMFLLISNCALSFRNHWGRSGDTDALYILFSLLAMLCLISGRKDTKSNKYMYLTGVFLSLSFLAKSYHIIATVLCMSVYILLYRKDYSLKNIVLLLLSFLIPILAWSIWRFNYDGLEFFKNMIVVDVLKRSTSISEQHSGSILFYVIRMIRVLFLPLFLIFISVWHGTIRHKGAYVKSIVSNPMTVGMLLLGIIPVILFSFVKTKLAWYINISMFPVVILCAVTLDIFLKETGYKKIFYGFLCIVGVASLIIYVNMFSKVQNTPIQQFLASSIDRSENFINQKIYTQVNEKDWTQSNILVSELYGDMICTKGGIEGFDNSSEGYLLTTVSEYVKSEESLSDTMVISQDDTYILVTKLIGNKK